MERLLKRLLPESFKAWTRQARAAGIARLARRTNLTRDPLSHAFLRGEGIEIGALNWPLSVPRGCRTSYVDTHSSEELRKIYPEYPGQSFPVDYVATIETLEGIGDATQDYAIANHVIEHSENPIQAFASLLRVLKVGGVLFFALPDKRFTFDAQRPVTPFEHLLRDYREGPAWSRDGHYREFALKAEGVPENEVEDRMRVLAGESGHAHVHFHVWTVMEMLEMVARLRTELNFPIELEAVSRTGNEAIFVLRKTAS